MEADSSNGADLYNWLSELGFAGLWNGRTFVFMLLYYFTHPNIPKSGKSQFRQHKQLKHIPDAAPWNFFLYQACKNLGHLVLNGMVVADVDAAEAAFLCFLQFGHP